MQIPSTSRANKQATSSLLPKPMCLFPTMGSLQEVIDFGESKLPITNKNEMLSLLMTMQNTILSQINKR